MTLHATFRGGPADNTDRSYPHISAVLPALWWTRDTIPTPRPPTGLPGAHLPPSVERGDRLAGQDGVAALIDRNSGAAYRLCCPDPARDGVWIYVISDPPSTSVSEAG